MKNLEKFAINPTNEFHILRHFEVVDDLYKETLVGKSYWYYDYSQKKFIPSIISQDDIECALKTIGTKFSKNISGIENPGKLLELLKEKFIELSSKNEIGWTVENENRRASFRLQYKKSVGKMNCILIDKLVEKDRKNITTIPRSRCVGENNIMVNVVSKIDLSVTDKIYVDIFETNQLPFFAITSFPDCSVDDIPDSKLVFVT